MAYDFSLKRAVIEVDRDADRRWSFATDKMKLAEDKDEVAPNSAPLEDWAPGPLGCLQPGCCQKTAAETWISTAF